MTFGSLLGEQRRKRQWSQAELASRLGTSRQTIIALENDQHRPSLDLAIRLSRLFNVSLDDLARALESDDRLTTDVFPSVWPATGPQPVVWSRVGSRRVLIPLPLLDHNALPDALWDPVSATVSPLPGGRSPDQVILIGGCDPFASWLAEVFHAHAPDLFLESVRLSSRAALYAWEHGQIHIAGTHLYDDGKHGYNPPGLVSTPHYRIPYLLWEEGLVTRPEDQPIRNLAVREPGSEAHALYQRNVARAPYTADMFFTHQSILEAVAHRGGWAGVGLGPLAASMGLKFEAWALESYDLWIRRDANAERWAKTLFDALESDALKSRFRHVAHLELRESHTPQA